MLQLDPQARPSLFAIDWGTSSCRIWALDARGRVLSTARSAEGMLATSQRAASPDPADRAAAFSAALDALAAQALAEHPGVPVLACGMVGSNRGWVEASYAQVPVVISAEGLPLTPADHRGRTVHIVPGIAQQPVPGQAYPEVMRGEETQIIGALSLLPDPGADRVLVLPGTHSKWARISRGCLDRFSTVMTGEVYAALMKHTILGQPALPTAELDEDAFLLGVQAGEPGRSTGSLAATIFSARTLLVTGQLAGEQIGDYLSGLLIGDEIAHLSRHYPSAAPVLLCGEAAILTRYRLALQARGRPAESADAHSTVAGLWRIALSAGLVDEQGPSDKEIG